MCIRDRVCFTASEPTRLAVYSSMLNEVMEAQCFLFLMLNNSIWTVRSSTVGRWSRLWDWIKIAILWKWLILSLQESVWGLVAYFQMIPVQLWTRTPIFMISMCAHTYTHWKRSLLQTSLVQFSMNHSVTVMLFVGHDWRKNNHRFTTLMCGNGTHGPHHVLHCSYIEHLVHIISPIHLHCICCTGCTMCMLVEYLIKK